MPNEMIGIVSAIGLTFLLFAFRHFVLQAERGKKRRHVAPEPSREYTELEETAVEDNAWLPRTPDSEEKCSDTMSVVTTGLLEVKSDDLESDKEAVVDAGIS